MDVHERRAILATGVNPDRRVDYVVSLKGRFPMRPNADAARVRVRYVPDKHVLDPTAFGRYLDALGRLAWPSLEEVAVTLLTDINNEVVARWVQVVISAPDESESHVVGHSVSMAEQKGTTSAV